MMRIEEFSHYQSWVEAEMEVAKGVRKRQWMAFCKAAGIFLAASVVIVLLVYVVSMGKDGYLVGMAVVWVMMLFVLLTVVTFLCMLPSFLKGKYRRKIKRAMKRQGFSDAERELFAREQMAARRDPTKSVSVVITKGQDHMPAEFTLSEHFACFTGGSDFGPHIMNVDGVEAFRVRTNTVALPTMTKIFSFVITMDQSVATYMIQLVSRGREQGRFTFSGPAVCEKVLDILRRRFPQN